MEQWSAEAEAFNFQIDWSVLPDLDPFVKPKLLANPGPFAEAPEPTAAPRPALVVVNRRSGGLVGAIGHSLARAAPAKRSGPDSAAAIL